VTRWKGFLFGASGKELEKWLKGIEMTKFAKRAVGNPGRSKRKRGQLPG